MTNKIVFLGTPEFAVPSLEMLHNEGHEMCMVVTQPDKSCGRGLEMDTSPVKKKAIELGIKVFQPGKINEEYAVKKIRDTKPDFIVAVAYGQLLKKEILHIPRYCCLNVHASILPKYRGASPINQAVINGEKKSGISIMKMEEGLDSGPVYNIAETEIDDYMTAGQLHDILKNIGAICLGETIKMIVEKGIDPVPQNNLEATYAGMLTKDMGLIKWHNNAREIHDSIRGMDPWPGSYFIYENKKYKVFNTDFSTKETNVPPGTVIKAKDVIEVSTGEGTLIIHEIQAPGKKRMRTEDYLRGNRLMEGCIF